MGTPVNLKRLTFNIASLVDLGQEVTSSKGYAEKMKAALYVVTGVFSIPLAALLVYAPRRRGLELVSAKGLRNAEGLRLVLGPGRIPAFPLNEPCRIRDLRTTAFYERNADAFRRLRMETFVPLFAKNEFVGALGLGRRLSRAGYQRSERDVLKVIACQLATTLHNAKLFRELTRKAEENKKLYEDMRSIYHETIQAFAAAIDAKDEYTKNHSYRVASYAVAIARELGWKERDVEAIYVAGLLHDIGKITIDRSIINKGAQLSSPERHEIRRHPQVSYDILSKIRFPWKDVAHYVRHHHERVDGNGYPDSLGGPELSEGVKILALADAFDAMTTDRPYRGKLPLAEAFTEVKKCIGTQFDGRISDVFFRVLRREINGEIKDARILPHLQAAGFSGNGNDDMPALMFGPRSNN